MDDLFWIPPPGPWQFEGNCVGMDPDDFMPAKTETAKLKAAQAVCAGCDVADQCFEYAVVHSDIQGVWGGSSEIQRTRARRARERLRQRGVA